MTRIALGIEYDGHEFYGWQAQTDLNTVQANLETAITKISGESTKLICAGRTDAGVHATGQVVHFDTEVVRELRAWTFGVNTHLPPTISVRWAQEVEPSFHARFSAISRRYRYVIYNHPIRSAIWASRVTWFQHKLDVEAMHQAALYLLGEHDFSSFRSSQCEAKTPTRNVHDIRISRDHHYVMIEIQANAFLHHMVRNIAGVLMRVGAGLENPQIVQKILDAKDRRAAFVTAPAAGLYLIHVGYPEPYLLPKAEDLPLFLLR
jgi:tRNA pseudouridine38-40 synthase